VNTTVTPGAARPRRGIRALVAIALAALLASCGQQPKDDLPVLRVGDQLRVLQTALISAGEDKPEGYRIEWSNFLGGPTVIAAQTGGSVDLGWMAETPLVFAQAAGSPVKVVAVSRGIGEGSSNIALIVKSDSPIRTVADLKGRKVGYAPGTITQYLVARALDNAGLSLNDVTAVRIASFSAATIDRGVADAFTIAEPMLSQGLADGTIRVLANGADPKRAALIADFVARTARATRWRRENVAKAAPFAAKDFNVSPQLAADILKRNPIAYTPIDPSIVASHQEEADLFHKLGLIRQRIDAAKLFDNRYDTIVADAENAK
jgi:sulfonate transport system substrate-binding protein